MTLLHFKFLFVLLCSLLNFSFSYGWGFVVHRSINESAIYLLPKPLLNFYVKNRKSIVDFSINADERKYFILDESSKHYFDFDSWDDSAILYFSKHTLVSSKEVYGDSIVKIRGILPWTIEITFQNLVKAFEKKNYPAIIRYSADLGHYVGDLHVPLHLCSNYNGQKTHQFGVHALFETRVPYLIQDPFSFTFRRAEWVKNVRLSTWQKILSISYYAQNVLDCHRNVSLDLPFFEHFSPDFRKGRILKAESFSYVSNFNNCLNSLTFSLINEARVFLADLWYSAWINAGQPDLLMQKDQDFLVKNEDEITDFTDTEFKSIHFDCD